MSNSVIQWSVTCQAPLSMGFSRREYWSALPFPSPGDLPYLYSIISFSLSLSFKYTPSLSLKYVSLSYTLKTWQTKISKSLRLWYKFSKYLSPLTSSISSFIFQNMVLKCSSTYLSILSNSIPSVLQKLSPKKPMTYILPKPMWRSLTNFIDPWIALGFFWIIVLFSLTRYFFCFLLDKTLRSWSMPGAFPYPSFLLYALSLNYLIQYQEFKSIHWCLSNL